MLNSTIRYTPHDLDAIKILDSFLPDRIFDSHMHLYDSSFLPNVFENNVHAIADVKSYTEAIMPMLCYPKKLRMNIIPYPADVSLSDKCNLKKCDDFLVSQLKKSEDNVGEIIVLPNESADNIQERLVHPNIKGLKCYYYFSGEQNSAQSVPEKYLSESAWEVAHKNKMCITLHLARDKSLSDSENLSYIKTMAKSFPDAKLVLAHCARAFAGWTCVEAVHELAHFDNIWFDFSAICESPSVFQILNKIGVEKCMWGSDYPVSVGRGKAISIADTFYWIGEDDLPLLPQKWIFGIENLMAIRQACIMAELGDNQIEDVFYNNASEFWDTNR